MKKLLTMGKMFTIASLITVIMLVLAYLGYVPSYISVTVSICSFVVAISSSIIYAFRGFMSEIKEAQVKNDATIQKSVDGFLKITGILADALEEMKAIHSVVDQNHADLESISQLTSQFKTDLSSKLDDHFKTIGEKSDYFSTVVAGNSTEVAKINTSIAHICNKIQESVKKIKNSTNQNAESFSKTIEKVSQNLSQETEIVVSKLNSLNDSLKEISRTNRDMKSDLFDVMETSNNIKEKLKDLKEATTAQTESLSDGESEIRQSIDKLRNSLTSCLEQLEIDTDTICNYIEDIKEMSQSVEESDKELLSRISEICK